MIDKRKYAVSLMNSVNECVFSYVVSSSYHSYHYHLQLLTVSVSIGRDVYRRLEDSEFAVSCCPYVDADF